MISTAPMKQLVNGMTPKVRRGHATRPNSLRYRDFLTVVLMLKDRRSFDDNWIYIHDPSVKVGRVQNFKSWSPEMVPDPTMLLWPRIFLLRGRRPVELQRRRPDRRGKQELAKIGLATGGRRGRLRRSPGEGVSGLRR